MRLSSDLISLAKVGSKEFYEVISAVLPGFQIFSSTFFASVTNRALEPQ